MQNWELWTRNKKYTINEQRNHLRIESAISFFCFRSWPLFSCDSKPIVDVQQRIKIPWVGRTCRTLSPQVDPKHFSSEIQVPRPRGTSTFSMSATSLWLQPAATIIYNIFEGKLLFVGCGVWTLIFSWIGRLKCCKKGRKGWKWVEFLFIPITNGLTAWAKQLHLSLRRRTRLTPIFPILDQLVRSLLFFLHLTAAFSFLLFLFLFLPILRRWCFSSSVALLLHRRFFFLLLESWRLRWQPGKGFLVLANFDFCRIWVVITQLIAQLYF